MNFTKPSEVRPSILSRHVMSIVAALFTLIIPPQKASADFQSSVESITPSADDVSGVLPPLPKRLAPYAWQGNTGTEYTVSFSVSQEPALVVAVGAEIRETTFSSGDSLLTVRLSYSGAAVLTDDSIPLPPRTFMVILDPGITTAAATVAKPPVRPLTSDDSRECYGPGRAPSSDGGNSSDFGDDDGLADPPQPRPEDTTVGFPSSAPGSWISTNSLYWCYIPPSTGDLDVGFKSRGSSGSADSVRFYLSGRYKRFLAARSGASLAPSTLALFSNELQASIDVQDSNDGILFSAVLEYTDGATTLTKTASAGSVSATANRRRLPPPTLPVTIENLISRSFSLGLREAISIAPDTINPSGSPVSFFGFVSDPELIGAPVQIIRVQKRRCPTTQATSATGVVIARTTVSGQGSYTSRVPNSTVFAGGSRRARVAARITRGSVQQSREVTLSNRNRSNRG